MVILLEHNWEMHDMRIFLMIFVLGPFHRKNIIQVQEATQKLGGGSLKDKDAIYSLARLPYL